MRQGGEISENNRSTSDSFSYQGLSTIVGQTEGIGAITQTVSFDNFGRVSQDVWKDTSDAITDGYSYTYDRDGNVLTKSNVLNANLNETYTYDNLGRLTAAVQGANPQQGNNCQYWFGLDALGNTQWFITNGNLTAGYTYNSDNQAITYQTPSGTVDLTYDSDGNLTIDQSGNTLTYDAWNRLVLVTDSDSNPVVRYTYDGIGRQITQTTYSGSPVATELYYDEAGQVVEEQQAGAVTNDYVWSLVYINAMVARISYDSSLAVTQLVYPQYDANFNVTSLVDASTGAVAERFLYDPYGTVTVLNPITWVALTGVTAGNDAYSWIYLFQGGRYDLNTGNYSFGARDYNPLLQRWTQLDPAGYPDGANAYGFVGGNPVSRLDPSGLQFPDLLFLNPPEDAIPGGGSLGDAGGDLGDSGGNLGDCAGRSSDSLGRNADGSLKEDGQNYEELTKAQQAAKNNRPKIKAPGKEWDGAKHRPKQRGIEDDTKSKNRGLRDWEDHGIPGPSAPQSSDAGLSKSGSCSPQPEGILDRILDGLRHCFPPKRPHHFNPRDPRNLVA